MVETLASDRTGRHRSPSRTVVFVGAFDPMHRAHVQKAVAAARLIHGSCVLMPIASIPHKPEVADIAVRVEIMRAQIEGLTNVEVVEETPALHSENYMFELATRPGDRVFSLLGRDSFNSIRALSCAGELLNHTTLIVAARDGYELEDVGAVAQGLASYERTATLGPGFDATAPDIEILGVWQNRTSPPHLLVHAVLGDMSLSSAQLRDDGLGRGRDDLSHFTPAAAAIVRKHYAGRVR